MKAVTDKAAHPCPARNNPSIKTRAGNGPRLETVVTCLSVQRQAKVASVMLQGWVVVAVALGYIGLLFL
ncbi:MAG TPA: hypothetical protein VFA80_08550, partial [Xanthobacteraceae bacterium]|nr:hypothetical protein [Xanthobacteraceae bacterium]